MPVLNHLVACTHDDYDIVWETSVEFNDQKQLVFRLEKHDDSGLNERCEYDGQYRHTETQARLSFEDAWRLAKRLNIPTLELPQYLAEKFGAESDVETDEVQTTFQRLLNFVLSKGIHYELHRCNEW